MEGKQGRKLQRKTQSHFDWSATLMTPCRPALPSETNHEAPRSGRRGLGTCSGLRVSPSTGGVSIAPSPRMKRGCVGSISAGATSRTVRHDSSYRLSRSSKPSQLALPSLPISGDRPKGPIRLSSGWSDTACGSLRCVGAVGPTGVSRGGSVPSSNRSTSARFAARLLGSPGWQPRPGLALRDASSSIPATQYLNLFTGGDR